MLDAENNDPTIYDLLTIGLFQGKFYEIREVSVVHLIFINQVFLLFLTLVIADTVG